LYNFPINLITKADFAAHMLDVYQYVSPIKVPFVDKNTNPIVIGNFSFGWTFGIWSTKSLAKRFIEFTRSRGVDLEAVYCTGKGDKESIRNFIKEGLITNNPVLLLIGFRPKLANCKIISPQRIWTHHCNRHWVTITELREDQSSEITTIKVSTWGGHSYLSLDDLMTNRRLFRGLVYFRERQNC
jgi:hypothetical protein